MKNENEKALAEAIRKSAIVWMGKTNLEEDILLVNINKRTHWVLVKTDALNLIISSLQDTLFLREEIFKILYEIFPEYKSKGATHLQVSGLPKGLSITGDYNEVFFDKDIKPLTEKTVVTFLDALGANVTMYEYTTRKVDNSHSLVPQRMPSGYSNYDPEVINQVTEDLSAYKDLEYTNPTVVEAVLSGALKAVMLVGPAGTGKSTEFKIAAAKNEIPYACLQFSGGTDSDDLLSTFVPDTTGKASFVLRRSSFTYFYQYGGLFCLDEINYGHARELSVFNSLLDSTAELKLDDGSTIKRHPNFRCIATLNPQYEGTFRLNAAFLDRFDVVYYPELSKKAIIDRLIKRTGYKNIKVLEVIYDKFEKLRDIYHSRDMSTEVTYRRIESFVIKLLLMPDAPLEELFDMSFIYNTSILDLNNIDSELKDLQDIRKSYVEEIRQALADSSDVEVSEGDISGVVQPLIDSSAIDKMIQETAAAFSNLDEEEEE